MTPKVHVPARRGIWITAIATFVVVAFLGVFLASGSIVNTGNGSTTATTNTTLVTRPSLPGDGTTATTVGGASARCKDGTYAFKGGSGQVSDADLCKDHGGVEQRLS